MDWYGSKRAIVARLDGLVGRLARAGVSPDAVTLAAVPVAAVGGVAVLASPRCRCCSCSSRCSWPSG